MYDRVAISDNESWIYKIKFYLNLILVQHSTVEFYFQFFF